MLSASSSGLSVDTSGEASGGDGDRQGRCHDSRLTADVFRDSQTYSGSEVDLFHALAHEVISGPVHSKSGALARLLGMPISTQLAEMSPHMPFALTDMGVAGLQLLEALLRRFPDFASSTSHPQSGSSLLHHAAAITESDGSRGLSIGHCLLKYGASVYARDAERRSPIHVAAAHGNTAFLALLKQHTGARGGFERLCGSDNRDVRGATPLLCAVRAGSSVCVRYLLAQQHLSPNSIIGVMSAIMALEDGPGGSGQSPLSLAFHHTMRAAGCLPPRRQTSGDDKARSGEAPADMPYITPPASGGDTSTSLSGGPSRIAFKAAFRCLQELLVSMETEVKQALELERAQQRFIPAPLMADPAGGPVVSAAASAEHRPQTAGGPSPGPHLFSPTTGRAVDVEGGYDNAGHNSGLRRTAESVSIPSLASKLYSPSGQMTDHGGLVAASSSSSSSAAPYAPLFPSPSLAESPSSTAADIIDSGEGEFGVRFRALADPIERALAPLIRSAWRDGVMRAPLNIKAWHVLFHLLRCSCEAQLARSLLLLCTYSHGARNPLALAYLRLRDRNEAEHETPLFLAIRAFLLPVVFWLVRVMACLKSRSAALQYLAASLYIHLDQCGARYLWPLMAGLGFYYVGTLLSPLLTATASNLAPWAAALMSQQGGLLTSSSQQQQPQLLVDPKTNALMGSPQTTSSSFRFWFGLDVLLGVFWLSGIMGSVTYFLARWVGPGFVVDRDPRAKRPTSEAGTATGQGSVSPAERAYQDGLSRGIEPPSLQSGYCVSCECQRPLRSKHCHLHDRCVLRFDHCCSWLDVCVGLQNHAAFLVFLVSAACFAASWLALLYVFVKVVPPAEGREWLQATKAVDPLLLLEAQRGSNTAPALAFVDARLGWWSKLWLHAQHAPFMCLAGVQPLWMLAFTLLLLYQQFQYISRGLTMNEALSVRRTSINGGSSSRGGGNNSISSSSSTYQYLTDAATGRFTNPFHRGDRWTNVSYFWRSAWGALVSGVTSKVTGSVVAACGHSGVVPGLQSDQAARTPRDAGYPHAAVAHARLSSNPINLQPYAYPGGVIPSPSASASSDLDAGAASAAIGLSGATSRPSLPRIATNQAPLAVVASSTRQEGPAGSTAASNPFSAHLAAPSPAFVIGTPVVSASAITSASGTASAASSGSVRSGGPGGFGILGGPARTIGGSYQSRGLLMVPSSSSSSSAATGIAHGISSGPEALRTALLAQQRQRALSLGTSASGSLYGSHDVAMSGFVAAAAGASAVPHTMALPTLPVQSTPSSDSVGSGTEDPRPDTGNVGR